MTIYIYFILVVDRVIEHGNHKLEGCILQVSKPEVNTPETKENITQQDITMSDAVVVTGMKGKLSQHILMIFFENTKRSGGGDVEKIAMDPAGDVAYISFTELGG